MRMFPDHQPVERDPLGPKPNLIAAVSSDASFRPIGCPYLSAIDPICDRDEEPGTMAFREFVIGTRSESSPTDEWNCLIRVT